jgi:4-nitrophenyl phosphatase
MTPPFLKTPEEYQKLVDSVDTFLLDCDGVIYHGPEVVKGVKEVLTMFRAAGAFSPHTVTSGCPAWMLLAYY